MFQLLVLPELIKADNIIAIFPTELLEYCVIIVRSGWLQNSLSDEDEVILLVGTTNNQSRMR